MCGCPTGGRHVRLSDRRSAWASPGFGQRQRVATGEALFWKVPPTDVVLTELPAELDLSPEMNSREIDQPPSRVTEHDSQFLQPVQDGLDPSGAYPAGGAYASCDTGVTSRSDLVGLVSRSPT